MTTTQVRKFPLDGFADTCIGDGARGMHGTNDELGTGGDALCTVCAAAERQALAIEREAARLARVTMRPACGCASKGHAHGAKYYDCMCCYGD